MLTYEKLNKLVINSIKRYIPFEHYRIFYFGSRVSGKGTSRSDLDVGIDAGANIPLDAIARIKGDLEQLPILQRIDLVDFSRVPEDFARNAQKGMVIIYER